MRLPKTLGACADRLFTLRAQKAALQAQLDAVDEERKAVEEHLVNNLPKSDARGVVGRLAKAVVTTSQVPTVKDWGALYKMILRTRDFSFLQRRVGEAAVKERWEAGQKVPGVEPFTVVKVSVTKV